jgi:hypothetical protein
MVGSVMNVVRQSGCQESEALIAANFLPWSKSI